MIELRKELNDVVDERDSLLQRILELQPDKFETKEHRHKYLDKLPGCCQAFQTMSKPFMHVKTGYVNLMSWMVNLEPYSL